MSDFIGKVIIKGYIEGLTGLRIGGSSSGLKIGGVDNPVITDPEGKPYIPGSSLKGKLKSLLEKKEGVDVSRGMHSCSNEVEYQDCKICRIFGVLGGDKYGETSTLTRIYIRDAFIDEDSFTEDIKQNLSLEWTEIKAETAIDRKKGTAYHGSLRQIERVPAGAKFKFEMIFNIFSEEDKELLKSLFIAMELLENDYLGGMGSRGYGQVEFKDIKIFWNKKGDYESGDVVTEEKISINDENSIPSHIVKNFDSIKSKLDG